MGILCGEEKVKNVQLKFKGNFKNIDSKYILKKIFDNLETKRILYLIKLNKKLKKILNININDYKEYSEIFSSIELELKPINNKYIYDKFINIEKEDEKYLHMYFNNKKEDTKRNYCNEDEKIRIIKIIIDYKFKSFEKLFKDCNCVESINFKKFNRNNITNMARMFYECSSLKELNLNNFNTNNVTNMSGMFYRCSALKELNLNNFNTNNVTDMRSMFCECSSLKKLNLNNFNTNNVTEMSFMF